MDVIAAIRQRAAITKRVIVLPEGADERSIKAADEAITNNFAAPILLGEEATILLKARELGLNPTNFRIINPETSEKLQEYAKVYGEMRARKGKPVTEQEALKTMQNTLYYGAMMVHRGEAAGSVAGAVNTSGAVIAAAARVIGTKPGIKFASSFFIMILKDTNFGHNGVLIYADCGLVPDPDAETLAAIAIITAQSAQNLVGLDPQIAMLSFSTKGSAEHALVDKVREATRIAKEKAPQLQIDGELQVDAALIPAIGARKAPGSPVAGKANILIFPDLNAGNIAYKLTERLAGAKAIGPLLQGFAKPCNDLSRGCSAEDIADTIAVTAVMAQS
jgi:phosphate acetyltransferase